MPLRPATGDYTFSDAYEVVNSGKSRCDVFFSPESGKARPLPAVLPRLHYIPGGRKSLLLFSSFPAVFRPHRPNSKPPPASLRDDTIIIFINKNPRNPVRFAELCFRYAIDDVLMQSIKNRREPAQSATTCVFRTLSQCPHLEHCHPKLRKCSSLIVLSRSAIGRANQQRLLAAEDFRNWKRIRNGVETIPAILRNCYHVDEMPVRGKIPGKFFFGAKISAVNFKKLLRQRRGLHCRPHNPLLA